MVEKMNAFVCDGCRICISKSAYGPGCGWVFEYNKDGTCHYCPACAIFQTRETQEKEEGE